MRKIILFLFLLATLPTVAQVDSVAVSPSKMFGYLSYDSVMVSLPAYAVMQTSMQQLREQYDAEMKRVENDFNKKYEEFLDGQRNFPRTILQKRQSELQEMLDKNIAFKKESQQLLLDSEQRMRGEMVSSIQQAVELIARERGYAFVLNTDVKAATWLNPAMGEDITEAVKAAIQQ